MTTTTIFCHAYSATPAVMFAATVLALCHLGPQMFCTKCYNAALVLRL